MRACVLTFTPPGGTGTQTVTGVSDADGDFIGKLFIFDTTFGALNTVTSGAAGIGAYSDSRGVDTGTVRSARAQESFYSPLNFKAVGSGESLGDFSIIDQWTGILGISTIDRTAKISAIRTGEFDVNYATGFGGLQTPITVTVLGGDDIDFAFASTTVNGTYTTPSKPQGLLSLPLAVPASSGGTAASVGGDNVPWGFATRDGVYGASTLHVVNQGQNFSVQRTSAWTASIDGTTGALGTLPTVSAWGDTSYTIANSTSIPVAAMAVCGEEIQTAGGVFDQPIVTGDQVIDLGIIAKVIWFFSVGQVAATTVYSSPGQFARGCATALSQSGYWGGEATNGNSGPQTGARYLSNNSVLRFGTPAAGSTSFVAVAALTDVGTDTTATLHWSSVDSTARQIIWFAIGDSEPPPPPPPEPVFRTREVVRRRLRRAPIVWNEKGGLQTRVRINLFAVDMQPGVGTSDTPDPLVMIRASKDGGFTWGNERRLTAGRVGEFFNRINAWQWGQGRDWVFEVSCTDPVLWNLVGAYFDAEGGGN